MASTSKHHHELDSDGVGKCSVPMWLGGSPAGFCNEPAYGEPPKSRMVWHAPRQQYVREDGRYDGYVPGLACVCHGGPKSRVFLDGNQWCAVWPDFINIQESPCGFGETPEAARKALPTQAGGGK